MKRNANMGKKYIHFIDTETTGLVADRHELLEVAVVTEEVNPSNPKLPGRIVREWCRKVKPQNLAEAEPKALEVNGYNDADWKNASPFADLARELLGLLQDGIIVGHNCLTGDSQVLLADGTTLSLSQMVATKHPGPVLTVNEQTGLLEPKSVVGWVKAPARVYADWVKIRVAGKGSLSLTVDHQVLTTRGRVAAKDVVPGDRILRSVPVLGSTAEVLVWGTSAGDASLVLARKGGRSPYLVVSHEKAQSDYLGMKERVLKGLGATLVWANPELPPRGFSGPDTHMGSVRTHSDARLGPIYAVTHPNGKKAMSSRWLEHMSLPALAIWYCDDGQAPGESRKAALCVDGLGGVPAADLVVAWMQGKGWPARRYDRPDGHTYVVIDGAGRWEEDNGIDSFWESIAPYVPICMGHKVPDKFRHLVSDAFWEGAEQTQKAWSDEVVAVGPLYPDVKKSRYDGRTKPKTGHGVKQYCLTVEGNANFFASGLCVSNCKFDVGFLEASFRRAGITPKIGYHHIDTVALAYARWGLPGDIERLSLDYLRGHLGIPVEGGHAALKDALDCREVFYRTLA